MAQGDGCIKGKKERDIRMYFRLCRNGRQKARGEDGEILARLEGRKRSTEQKEETEHVAGSFRVSSELNF